MKSRLSLSKFLKVLFTVNEVCGAAVCLFGLTLIVLSLCDAPHLTVPGMKCGLLDVRTEIDASALQLKTPAVVPGKIRFDGTMYVFLTSTYSKDYLCKSLGRPFGFSALLVGVLVWAISDLFRRLLRSVERRDVFTATNVRRIRWIGSLIILGAILSRLMAWWQATAVVAFARGNLATEGISYHPSFDWGSVVNPIVVGLLALALAEVFNQGILLREDNDLTV